MRSVRNVVTKAVAVLTLFPSIPWAAEVSSAPPRIVLAKLVARRAPNPNSRLGPLQDTVRKVACQEGVPPEFALAVIEHESKFDNTMRGSHGEIGASQILPATATALGFDPARLGSEFAYNARAGVSILKMLLRRAAGDQREASCCYRAGPRWAKLPSYKQSQVLAYARAIERLKNNYSSLDCRP